jgi:hypothetical protein
VVNDLFVFVYDICKINVNSARFLLMLQPSPIFTEQLTAFEVGLEHGSKRKKPPKQLHNVLQVLCSTVPANLSGARILVFWNERSVSVTYGFRG